MPVDCVARKVGSPNCDSKENEKSTSEIRTILLELFDAKAGLRKTLSRVSVQYRTNL